MSNDQASVIVHHQGYITMKVPALENRVLLAQESDEGDVIITIVGRQNLDLIIEALNEVREVIW